MYDACQLARRKSVI